MRVEKHARQEARQRDHDDFGDQIGRLHPGDLVRSSPTGRPGSAISEAETIWMSRIAMNMPNTMKMKASELALVERLGRPARRRRALAAAGAALMVAPCRGRAAPSRPSAPSSVGFGWLSSRVWTVATTDRPGRRSRFCSARGAKPMRTVTRCTILVKLPVALSGGSSENCEPDAGAIERHDALDRSAVERVDGDVDLLPGPDAGELRFLEIGVDIDLVERHEREQPRARLHILRRARPPCCRRRRRTARGSR